MPEWQKFKLKITNNNIKINLIEYESNELNKIPENYKSQLTAYPTLLITDYNNSNNNKKLEGYYDILNYLNT